MEENMFRLMNLLTFASIIVLVSHGSSNADISMVQNVQAKCNNDFKVMNENAKSDEQKTIVDTAMNIYKDKETQLLKDAARLGKSGKFNESENSSFKQKIAETAEFCKTQKNKVFYARKKPIGMKWD
jgi:O-succinylbenzoate synthase